jgi:hypothetical protein
LSAKRREAVVDAWESLVTETEDAGEITEVIRPAAVVPEEAARAVLMQLTLRDRALGGAWESEASVWRRYDVNDEDQPVGSGELIGSIQIAYGVPTRYDITIYRATVTRVGASLGWTVESLCDEALGLAGLNLANCPRADLTQPPRPLPAS